MARARSSSRRWTSCSAAIECFYFFCRGVQDHVCDAPYSNMTKVEDAVAGLYGTVIRFTPEFVAQMREEMQRALHDEQGAQQLLRDQVRSQIRALSVKEENLVDLAADGELPQQVIRTRLRDIAAQRRKLERQLDDVQDSLSEGARVLDLQLRLLENPHSMYAGASDEVRRRLNQAVFKAVYVDNDEVTGYEVREPLAELLAAQEGHQVHSGGGNGQAAARGAFVRYAPKRSRATPKGGSALSTVDDVLAGVLARDVCSRPSMVREAGLEPARPRTPGPKPGAAASYATRARGSVYGAGGAAPAVGARRSTRHRPGTAPAGCATSGRCRGRGGAS